MRKETPFYLYQYILWKHLSYQYTLRGNQQEYEKSLHRNELNNLNTGV